MESSSQAEGLLRRCQRGDETALADLMRLYQQRVFRFTLRVSGDASLAEEATVDCFYRVWTKCRQWRGVTGDGSSGETWIFRIAHRAVLDAARSRQRWWRRLISGATTTEDDTQPTPLEALVENEQQQQLANKLQYAIASLNETDRALVHLYYFEERTLAEIAVVLDATRDALKMRLMRVRARLGKLLETDDVE